MDYSEIVIYIFAFIALYFEVFLLLTFIQNRKEIKGTIFSINDSELPTVTIAVPCYNEEKTIKKTLKSLLDLDYPTDKYKIVIIDDGSKDKTLEVAKEFTIHKNVKVITKENGGKHTALNLCLESLDTDLFGCLDADSYVDKSALKKIAEYFKNPETMAVVPSVIVHEPKNIIQMAQKVEYDLGIYVKKMLSFIGAIHVTPGPFSFFRKEVFIKIGNYRHAHNTEDMEIAYRMQENGLVIDHCQDAFVYTTTPSSIKKLYKQRLRWINGFIGNTIDYRRMIFNKKYGNISFFTLPAGFISICAVLYAFFFTIYHLVVYIYQKIIQIKTVGLNIRVNDFKFDWFFVDTRATIFLAIVAISFLLISIVLGRKISTNKKEMPYDVILFLLIYNIVAPFWVIKAVYNTVFSRKTSWR